MEFLRGSALLGGIALGLLAIACGDDGEATGGGPSARAVSFHADIEPLLQRSCLNCHTDGEIGGFSLREYDNAAALSKVMAAQVEAGLMPPYGAKDSEDCEQLRPWKDDLRLTDDEIAVFRAWAEQGAPKGDPADAPPPFEPLGTGLQDVAIQMTPSAPAVVEGSSDQFLCVIYDPALTEEKWIDGVHFVPGNSLVAHHALTFRADREEMLALSGGADRFPCFGGTPGEVVSAWAPGAPAFELPDDVGIKLTPEQVMVVQMHYHPTGDRQEDTSTLELSYRDDVPAWEFVVLFPGNAQDAGDGLLPGPNDRGEPEFRIPANVEEHTEQMRIEVPKEFFMDLPMLMVAAHMHYVGYDLKFEIERLQPASNQPASECLIHVPKWDFNWQRFYSFDTPIAELPTVRAGDVLTLTCKYNNSKSNPFVVKELNARGLSEPEDVLLGEETLDEMCLAPVGLLVPAGIL